MPPVPTCEGAVPSWGDETGLYDEACAEKEASKLALDDALARQLWDRSAAWAGLPQA